MDEQTCNTGSKTVLLPNKFPEVLLVQYYSEALRRINKTVLKCRINIIKNNGQTLVSYLVMYLPSIFLLPRNNYRITHILPGFSYHFTFHYRDNKLVYSISILSKVLAVALYLYYCEV